MSRLLPRSVAGRTTLVLVAGMLLVVASGIAVGTMTMGGGQASLADRVATVVAVAETAPASARPAVYAGAGRVGLSIRDVARTEATPAVSPDWFTDRLGERLARDLAPLGARVLAIGHTVGTGAEWPAMSGRRGRRFSSGWSCPTGHGCKWSRADGGLRSSCWGGSRQSSS